MLVFSEPVLQRTAEWCLNVLSSSLVGDSSGKDRPTTCRHVFRMRSSALSDWFHFILFSLVFFSFPLYGAVVSALRASPHPPRLLLSCIVYTVFVF